MSSCDVRTTPQYRDDMATPDHATGVPDRAVGAPAATPSRAATVARGLFLATALISLVTISVEFVYTVLGLYADSEPFVGTRLVRWFSYFTNASNILCICALVLLARDPSHDGRWFRPMRLAGLVGITVTFLVYMVALRPAQTLEGIHVWTNAGYHISVPILVVVGWFAFGPRPRFDGRALRVTLTAIAVWIVWTFVHGAVSGWYPYAIINVTALGYPTVLRTAVLLVALIAGIALLFFGLDRKLPARDLGDASSRSDLRHRPD